MGPSLARLLEAKVGAAHPVSSRCIIGRSPVCAIPIDGRYASQEHAKISWTGSQWEIRDLGSRNGTFLGGRRLEPGRPEVLGPGSEIAFGDPEELWRFEDAAAPEAFAISLSDRSVITGAGNLIALPDEDHPELSIYPDSRGQGWLVEDRDGETRSVDDQDIVSAGGASWRLELPYIAEATPMLDVAMTIDNVALRFRVSRNEETVKLGVILHGRETPLEPREHGYLLLTLARARREDVDKPPDQKGWRKVNDLLKMLRIDENTLNVSVHRARQQLAAIGLEGAASVVEVRRGQRRLGVAQFEIEPLPD